MDFVNNVVRTEAPNFAELGIPAVNTSDEVNILGTPATRIISSRDRSHRSDTDILFCKPTAVRMSATRSEHNYSYTDFQIWRENQDFGRQNNPMSQPPLDLTTIGTNMNKVKTSQFDLIPIRTKIQNSCHEHDQQSHQHDQKNIQSEKEKCTYQRTHCQTHHCQTRQQANLIHQMIEITANPKARNALKRKIVRNTINRTCQTHHRAIMISPTTVTIDARDARDAKIRRTIGKRIL